MRILALGLCYLGLLAAASGVANAHGDYYCTPGVRVCAYAEPYGEHHNPHTYVDVNGGPTGGVAHFYYRHDIGFYCVGAGGITHMCSA
jgi:hypothetical protein